ncbi:MAG: galactose oxidase, partial [Maribacter sp.]
IRPISIFDPNTESWSIGKEPPIELHHFQPIVNDNKIYIVGALTGGWPNETPTTHIYIYDTLKDTWSKGDEIPEHRRRGSTGNVLYNGKIYISCGIKNGHIGDYKHWLDSYNLKTGDWSVLADAPRARDHFQAVLKDGHIYALAGRNTGKEPENPFAGTISENDVYNIEKDSWTTLPNNIPTERAGNAAILYKGNILVVGGESQSQETAHREMESLDTKTKEWKLLPKLNVGRHGTGLVIYNQSVYIASGCGNRGGEPELTSMERYIQ